jgi:hypothetical protein
MAISVGVAVTIVSFLALISWTESSTVTVRYDCRMLIGGWHPDFPARVIEDCRNKNKDNK